ncbi:MAG TPA: hypothetical protein VLA49_21770 [Anaerolineales bacterium]|nr:hypothetical protein [Anaerolineales bacterium]
MMSNECQKFTRGMHPWEIEEFEPIFGNTLDYQRVRIVECTSWPNALDRLGRRLKGMPPPKENEHNAVTLGNTCYFPVRLPEELVPHGTAESYKIDWLVHELTHVWQFQQQGWLYLWRAVRAQLRDKAQAYDYGGEDGLIKSRKKNKIFKQFNPEQQGNIVQAYYVRKRAGKDTSSWQPFIDDLKKIV